MTGLGLDGVLQGPHYRLHEPHHAIRTGGSWHCRRSIMSIDIEGLDLSACATISRSTMSCAMPL